MSKQTLDNLKIAGVQQGAVNHFGNVLRDLQVEHGTTVEGSLNVLNRFNDIINADNIKTLKIDTLETTKYMANSLLNAHGTFVNTATIETASGVIPSDIDPYRGSFVKTYEVIIPERNFDSNVYNVSSNVLTSTIDSLLYNNPTYSNAGVMTALEYAVNNQYVSNYNSLDDTSFVIPPASQDVQDSLQYNTALLQTKVAKLLK
jgi:hypothetical protein